MSAERQRGGPQARAKARKKADRSERLAAALRANLERRKDQARAREEPEPPATGADRGGGGR